VVSEILQIYFNQGDLYEEERQQLEGSSAIVRCRAGYCHTADTCYCRRNPAVKSGNLLFVADRRGENHLRYNGRTFDSVWRLAVV